MKNKIILILLSPIFLLGIEFHYLSMEEAIQMAMKQNPTVKIADERINDARQMVYQAVGAALPSVAFQGSKIVNEKVRPIANFFYVEGVIPDPADPITFLMANPTLDFDMTLDYQMDLSVTQPLFTGGKISLGTIMARTGLDLVKTQVEQERNNLAYQVIQSYLGLLVTKEFYLVATEGYQTAQEFFEISKLLHDQGMISKLDLLQAEVQAANLLPQRTQAENGVIMAEAALRMLLGLSGTSSLVLTDSLKYDHVDYSLGDLKTRALNNRSEVQQMRLSQSLSKLNVNMAMTDYLPMVAMSYSYSTFGDADMDMTDWDDSRMVAVGFSYNLFNGGSRYSKLRQAQIAMRQTDFGFEALQDGIGLEVEQTYLSLKEAEKNILSQRKTVSQAEEAARLAKIQYQEGTITNLQANQIQMSLTAARANYLQALFSYTLAEISIRKAVGESLYQ